MPDRVRRKMKWMLDTISQKGIFEVNLKYRGMRVPALDVRFPKHKCKSADADEHDYYLEKYRRTSLHKWRFK